MNSHRVTDVIAYPAIGWGSFAWLTPHVESLNVWISCAASVATLVWVVSRIIRDKRDARKK